MNARRSWWPAMVILPATLALAVIAVRWADREFQRVEPPGETFRPAVSRPEWIPALHRPYRRLQNAWFWACVAATVGMGAGVALDGRWRRPFPPGTVVVLVAILVLGVTSAQLILVAPAIARRNGLFYGLRNALQDRVPGAIVGSWVVLWGRKVDWRGHLVSSIWMADVGLLVAYAILFG